MKRLLLVALIVFTMVVVTACGGNNAPTDASNNTPVNQSDNTNNTSNTNDSSNQTNEADTAIDTEQASKETKYPLTIKDATGLEMTFTQAPQRIVSTSPSETEILFALGLGDLIFGVSDFDNYPDAVQSKPRVGSIVKPNEEAIIAAEPDLVVSGVSTNNDTMDKLRELGLNIYKTEAKNMEEVLAIILQIGEITNTQQKAEDIVASMREDIRRVTEATSTINDSDKKRVYIEYSPGWTVGKGEFMDELITMAGAINIASDIEGWSPINEETIIQQNPEVIFYTADIIDNKSGKSLEDLITSRSGWDHIQAIQDDRLVGLNADLMARTGPRLTEGLLAIVEGVYPGLVQP